jgi:lipopolysaccharide/colanic/teichoic acid biosynthesis glycosyltransferase
MKRIFDLVFAGAGLIVLAPLLAAIALAIKLTSRGPVFYRGERVGLNGKIFRMFKFRTMVINAEQIGGSSTPDDDPRLTRVGKFLRRYKLDELPQFINVVVGDMSLVGPRPQVEWVVERYTPEERLVLTVRPGITDYASVKFHNEGEILRGSANPDEDYFRLIHPMKMQLSIEYVKNASVFTDVKIILRTLLAILK